MIALGPLLALGHIANLGVVPTGPVRIMPNGSFIQWYLAKTWNDATWQAEFRYMRELKMSYLVFAPTVETGAAYYPTQIPGVKEAEPGRDVVDACLRNAQRAGIKVFLGLNFHEDWWKKGASEPAWLDAQMEQGNLIADELYANYHAKYPKSFYGWYWVWEVDNGVQTDAQADAVAKALDLNVRHLKTLDPAMPVMLCPYMNCLVGKPEAWGAYWRRVFAHSSLGKGDVFAPQDCIGSHMLTLQVLPQWFGELRKAVDSKPGLKFWVDTETFDQTDWTSATIDRLDKQLRAVAPYVEDGITFAYCHYDSPNVGNPGRHAALKRYLETGVVPTQAPPAPTHVAGRWTAKGPKLSWTATQGPFGDSGFDVYKDGKKIARIEPPKGVRSADVEVDYVDEKVDGDGPITYEVLAYDFYGNVSNRVIVTVAK